jgi:hypothetical protein
MTEGRGFTDVKIPVQYWVIKPDGQPKTLLREDVGIVSRWDYRVNDWVPDQEFIEDIYGDDSWDTYRVKSMDEVEQIKDALKR